MAAIRPGALRLFMTPWVQCRHKGKYRTKNQKSHFKRRMFEFVTQPVLPAMLEDPAIYCSVVEEEKMRGPSVTDNPYKEYLKRKCREALEAYPTMLVYQQHSVKARREWEINVTLGREGFQYLTFEPIIMSEVLEEGRLRNLSVLVDLNNRYVMADNTDVQKILSITKKIGEIMLLGGVVEDRLMTREGLTRYAELPGLEAARGEMCAILGSAAGKTRSLLTSHQQQLSANLSQYITQNTDTPS